MIGKNIKMQQFKPADQCTSISEIRQCIDLIDRQIIDNLGNRASYVLMAADFKNSISDVLATDRVNAMIQERRKWALDVGLEPSFIEELYRFIVNYFVNNEINHFKAGNETAEISDSITITEAVLKDAPLILALQKRAFLQEAEIAGTFNIIPMIQNLEAMRNDFTNHTIIKAVAEDLIVGSARARVENGICLIGRVIVEPVYQKRGIGSALVNALEERFTDVLFYELFTAEKSVSNIKFYTRLGYKEYDTFEDPSGVKMVLMRKRAFGQAVED
jgi:chorismate mutase/N-acetylglutamate synthase-like GNAT family acetyltransferase